jgi:hypothetical protein
LFGVGFVFDGVGRCCRSESQLRVEFLDIADLRQRRQFVERLQHEIVQEALGGAEQFGLAGNIAIADHANPLTFLERLDDVRRNGNAADLLDLATRDRLTVGNQRKRLEQGSRILRLALRP